MSIDERQRLGSLAPSDLAIEALRGHAIVKAMGMWLRYDAKRNQYVELSHDEVFKLAWDALDKRAYVDKDGIDRVLHMTPKLRADVVEAMMVACLRPETSTPFWRGERDGDSDPRALVPVRNGFVDWRTGELRPATPRLVHTCAAAVDYDPKAPEPRAWLRFLDEIFGGDAGQIELVHEILGGLLAGRSEFQKIFFLMGPPRSGKGTILKVAEGLLGRGNIASPRISQLQDGGFGLASLIGKRAALVADARCSAKDTKRLVELLLTISGGDLQTIQRKYRDDFVGRLDVQFLIVSNELLRLDDGSGAIASRMLVMKTKQSFLGKEDTGLFDRDLLPELPGIMNLAIEGARRLVERGRHAQPRASVEAADELFRHTSTVAAFARECLWRTSGDADWPSKEEIFEGYVRYCRGFGLPSHDPRVFWKKLGETGVYSSDMESKPHGGGRIVRGLHLWDGLVFYPNDDAAEENMMGPNRSNR